MKTRWQKRWPVAVVAAAALIAFVIWRPRRGQAAADSEKPSVPTVAVVKAAREDLFNVVTVSVDFRPYVEVTLNAKVSGYGDKMNVDFGDKVKAGQSLATIEVPELKDELDAARAAEQRAEADYTNAHLIYNTWTACAPGSAATCPISAHTFRLAVWWTPSSTKACPPRSTFRSAACICAAPMPSRRRSPKRCAMSPGVSDVLVPQDVDYPALKIDIDRERASELGLSAQEILDSLITALTSDGLIAPSYWIDPANGNNYLLTVQYPENCIKNRADLGSMPLRSPRLEQPTRLDTVVHISHIEGPTEVDHYQIRRAIDVYVSPKGEDLSGIDTAAQNIINGLTLPENTVIHVRGAAMAMKESFTSFGLGLLLSIAWPGSISMKRSNGCKRRPR